jgi:hypothetical protein
LFFITIFEVSYLKQCKKKLLYHYLKMKASVTLFFLTALFVFFQTNLYADTETHWKNGDVLMLSTHTRGNGITIAIIGDGFDAEEMRKGGKYETRCRELADHFFHLPVIKDFKDLFDFYCVMAVPPVSGVNNTLGMFEGDIWIAGRKGILSAEPDTAM